MYEPAPITILLADDQALVRAGVRRLLAASLDLRIVGESAERQQALDLMARLQPDILLVSIGMLGPQGLADLATWRARDSRTKILLLTDRDSETVIIEALRHGAHGMISKQAPPRALRKALRAVQAGELWAPRRVVARVVETLRQQRAGPLEGPAAAQAHLTAREREIIQGVQRGLTNLEIAAQLGISAKTVKTHLRFLFQKLGILRRQQLRRSSFPL
jgi:DNA-binding NarL/FixJ family response regulator